MTDSISFTVDGKIVMCRPNDTYLEAIQRSTDIKIPTLCHEPELKPSGACRICVIEVEGAPALVTACSTPVRGGSIVKTNTERVRNARQSIVELLLASHPLNCTVCDKTGKCELQQLAYDYVPADRLRQYEGKKPTVPLIEEKNEFFELDYASCIRCGKCVRVVEELQLCGVLSTEQRGFDIYPTAGFGRSFEEAGCVACGNCVTVCPVSALMPNTMKGSGRNWELERTVTTCVYCGVGCQFEIVTNPIENRIVYVDSYRPSIVNGLSLCVKGRYGNDFIHNPDRIDHPMIKRNGKLEIVSWKQALDLIESKFKSIKSETGPDSLAVLTSAKCTNEENYLLQKFARAGLGTNNVDHCARLCHASTVAGLARAFGSGAMTNSIEDLTQNADVVFIIGSNTTEAHPVIGSKLKQAINKGITKLIVADPREIELADWSEIYLQQLPGSDVALINAMIKVILEENLHDVNFIRERTENFEQLEQLLTGFNIDDLAKIANVPEKLIREAARMYASAKSAAIVYSMGITQHTTGTDNVLSLANLAMLTGNIGRPGTGVNPLRGQNNVQGACDLGGLPNVYPGYQKVDIEENRLKFQKFWNVDNLDNKVGLTIVEIMNEAFKGNIRGIFIMGENPVLSDPNVNHVREALSKVDFLVVQDLFITETAKYADVILPAASFAEKNGTFTNTERRVQRVRQALSLTGERLPDWQIITMLLNRFGVESQYISPKDIMDEIAEITPIYAGMSYDRLAETGLQWPCKSKDDPGTKILHQTEFSRGKGKFHPVEYLDPAEMPDNEYPLILTTGRILYHFHTGEMTRRSKGLNARRPYEKSEINIKTAERLGINDGDKLEIESRRGKLETIAKVTERIQEDVVFMSFHFKESAANLLTNDALDPLAKIPEFKVCAIKVKKL